MRLLVDEHRADLGPRPGTSRSARSATPTTRCCRRRWRTGRCRCSARFCRGTWRSSTRSTGASSTRCAREYPGDEERIARLSLIDEEGEQARAHGAPGHRRQPRRQRRRRAALRAAEGQRAQGLLRAVAGAVQQQDQRRDAAPLPGAVQPRSAPSCSTSTIGEGWLTDLDDCEGWRRSPTIRRSGSEWREVKRANKSRLAEYIHSTHRASSWIPTSMFDVQVKRIHEYKRQHLNVLHIITLYHRLKQNPRLDDPAAHLHLRRQGRARLLHGQADHQAHQRRRRRRSTTIPTSADCLKVVFLPNFNVTERAPRLSGGRPVRADLDRRQGGLRHRQHEVLHERRADHRHAGRRQRRDPRGGRARRTSSCSV